MRAEGFFLARAGRGRGVRNKLASIDKVHEREEATHEGQLITH
jgi:hypothetical protein